MISFEVRGTTLEFADWQTASKQSGWLGVMPSLDQINEEKVSHMCIVFLYESPEHWATFFYCQPMPELLSSFNLNQE